MTDPEKATLEDVGARLKALQDAVAEKKTVEKAKQGAALDASVGFRIGIELVAGVLVGAGIGWYIDKQLATSPIFMLAFISLGFAASVMSVFRILKNLDQSVGLGRALREKEGREKEGKADATPPKPPKGFEDEDD